MENMFQNVNPGLSRRFPMSSAFVFEDFDQSQLRKILDLKLTNQGFGATDQAKNVALEMLARARNRPNFGNAGEVDIILNEAKSRHQKRLSSKETDKRTTLEALDFDKDFDRAERSDTNVAKLFEGTVGCELIVAKLAGFQKNVQKMKELGMDPKEGIPFNFLFRGPPGTGKTSTARKMGKVFYDMGFLATAEVVDCSATDLIGQYVGQTGPKVQQLLDKALGRVLFVDEAYRLAEGGFAREAVDELVDCVTKDRYRGRLIIILAGYENDINRLLSINPGMSSRFPEVIAFNSLGADDCLTLLLNLLQKQKRKLESRRTTNNVDITALQKPSNASKEMFLKKLSQLSEQSGWANARDVECLAKAMFGEALKVGSGGHIPITTEIVDAELDKMLLERGSRGGPVGTTRNSLTRVLPPEHAQAPPAPFSFEHNITTAHQKSTAAIETVEDAASGCVENDENAGCAKKVVIRDAGVTDEVWEQLELNKQAQEATEARYQALVQAKKDAKGDARERILKELIEEEERKQEREKQLRKAEELGRCPAGWHWIKEAEGYRCAGGSHFVSNEQILSG